MNKHEAEAGVLRLDLHGKNAYQARVALNAALRRAGAATYRVRVIHGWHGGEVLRDLVRDEFAAHPKVKRVVEQGPGETDLVLREY